MVGAVKIIVLGIAYRTELGGVDKHKNCTLGLLPVDELFKYVALMWHCFTNVFKIVVHK